MGKWWQDQLVVGPFANITEANAWAVSNPGALFVGLLCTVSGVQYTWQGAAGGGWVGGTYIISTIATDVTPQSVATSSYVDDDGIVKSAAGFYASDYLAVTPGQKLICALGEGTWTKFGSFYDAAKTPTSSVYANATRQRFYEPLAITAFTMVVPSGSYFVRFSYRADIAQSWNYACRYVGIMPTINSTGIPKTGAAMGDSIINGFTLTGTQFWNKAMASLGISSPVNLGINGTTVANYGANYMSSSTRLSTIPKVDLFIFEGGYNDWDKNIALGSNGDVTNATYYGALDVVAKFLLANLPASRIVWWLNPGGLFPHGLNGNGVSMDLFATAFITVAQKYGFQIVDARSRIIGTSTPGAFNDIIHPSDFATPLLADQLVKEILAY